MSRIAHSLTPCFRLLSRWPAGKKEEVLRLGMGVLLEMMVRRMEAAAAAPGGSATAAAAQGGGGGSGGGGGGGGPKMYLYSGHDSSVMPILAALGKHVQDW